MGSVPSGCRHFPASVHVVGGRAHNRLEEVPSSEEWKMSDKIETECPDCGGRIRFTLDDVAKQRSVRCSRGHNVKLQDEGGNARKASKSMDDLDRALKDFGK